ncbi:hypothetical protein [Leifsonia poae]|uniref:hypothetical protein n=1 Tax=Leifsonia poae TaxID=110933 RepID=UPI001CBBC31F|nr:hypothetical protein [Leifsonia poae]
MEREKNRIGRDADRAAEWLDGKLFPILGPPPIGPYDLESPRMPEDQLCPLCGHRIDEHGTQRDHEHAYLLCPEPSHEQLQVS